MKNYLTIIPVVVPVIVDDNRLSSHSNKEDLDEVLDIDGTIENDSLESESDVEEHCDLTEKLSKWAVENNCTRSSINQLLQILRESGHILPKDSRTLLQIKILKNDDVVITANKTITVSIKCFVCDAPARSFLKCVVNHTGYSSCERCEIKGE